MHNWQEMTAKRIVICSRDETKESLQTACLVKGRSFTQHQEKLVTSTSEIFLEPRQGGPQTQEWGDHRDARGRRFRPVVEIEARTA